RVGERGIQFSSFPQPSPPASLGGEGKAQPVVEFSARCRSYDMIAKLLSAACAAWLAFLPAANAADGQKAYPFFPFCIDWHDAKKRSFQERAVMLKELG